MSVLEVMVAASNLGHGSLTYMMCKKRWLSLVLEQVLRHGSPTITKLITHKYFLINQNIGTQIVKYQILQ